MNKPVCYSTGCRVLDNIKLLGTFSPYFRYTIWPWFAHGPDPRPRPPFLPRPESINITLFNTLLVNSFWSCLRCFNRSPPEFFSTRSFFHHLALPGVGNDESWQGPAPTSCWLCFENSNDWQMFKMRAVWCRNLYRNTPGFDNEQQAPEIEERKHLNSPTFYSS